MKDKFKKLIPITIIIILVALIGYGTGRMSAPVKTVVEERIKVEQVEKQVVVEKVKTDLQVVYVQTGQKNTHTETMTEKRPDGTVITKVIENTQTKTEVKTDTNLNKVSDMIKINEKTVAIDQSKVVTTVRDSHNWSVSVQPGIDFAGLAGKSTYNALDGLAIKHFVVGASVERRLIGPMFGGVWGNTQGTGGVSIKLEF